MISHKHKCIFIHIPKCAGTSVEYALGHYDRPKEQRKNQDHRFITDIQTGVKLKDIIRSRMNMMFFIKRLKKD